MYFLLLQLLLLLSTTKFSSALFEGCDYVYNLNVGTSYVESPYYPQNYPTGTSCRYKLVAPLDYQIKVSCDLNLPKSGSYCSTDNFYVSTDGDTQLRGSEQFCGAGQFTRNSMFRSVVLAYSSSGGGTGRFRCTLTVTPQPCECGWYSDARIVHGTETAVNEYPSMAYISNVNSPTKPYCGATIVTHRYAVTAAHCATFVTDPSRILLTVGDHNINTNTDSIYMVRHQVARVVIHPSYNTNRDNYDIALIQTASVIEWTRGVGPACLPPSSATSNTFAYNYVDVLGWGTQSFGGVPSSVLQKVQLMVITNQACQTAFPDNVISGDMMCTYDYTGNYRDSCQYDSGGPVIRPLAKQFLIGVVSFGKFCAADRYSTGVNTRITTFVPWIKQVTGHSCDVAM